jgi:hypothetical protein
MNRVIPFLLCALLPALARADATVDDEVRVTAKRQLEAMRKEIVAAEDRFFAKYNELNTKREYRISCSSERPTGTLFNRRKCNPEFVTSATGGEARAWLGQYSMPPAFSVIDGKSAEYKKNAVDLVKKNPELLQLLLERHAAQMRYDEAVKRAFGPEKQPASRPSSLNKQAPSAD